MTPACELCGEPMPAGEEMFKFHGYSGPCPKPPMSAPRPEGMSEDSRGLSIDMLDADRLRSWAEHFDTYGANVTHWASVSFMVEHLRGLARRLEEAVRDVGSLRADGATLRERVRKLPSPTWRQLMGSVVQDGKAIISYHVGCDWCDWKDVQVSPPEHPDHPDNGCLWSDVHKASAPKEPTV